MRRLVLLLFAAVILLPPPLRGEAAPGTVLVVHSYGRDLSWTEELHQGIVEAFRQSGEKPDLRVEYLDMKHRVAPDYLDRLGALLRYKFRGVAIDGVILSDNGAFDFYRRHLSALFSDVPVVAVGYNGSVPPLPANVHVIPEELHLERTLDLALRQNPGARRICAFHDGTETGRAMEEEIRPLLVAREGRGISWEIRGCASLAEAESALGETTEEDILLLLAFSRDERDNRGVTPREVVGTLSLVAPAPLYVPWTHFLGFGTLGGYMLSPRNVGYTGARYLEGLWRGQSPAILSRAVDLQAGYFADYAVMRRFGLDEGDFPPGTVIVGRPPSLYERHREILLAAAVVIALLLVVIALLMAALSRKNRLLRHRAELQFLQKELLDAQEETIDLIGDAIEGRSHETANHVRRVAEVAALLGEKRGLDASDVDLLRRAAPLHDLGKIAVPDAVLSKPGRLSDEEFEEAKKHAAIGAALLGRSRRRALQVAALIADQHHERWDGSGYPRRLAGEAIHIMGRLVAVADVFDALLSRRCYKEPWTAEAVADYFRTQRGRQFDPDLVDLLLNDMEAFLAVRERFPDQ